MFYTEALAFCCTDHTLLYYSHCCWSVLTSSQSKLMIYYRGIYTYTENGHVLQLTVKDHSKDSWIQTLIQMTTKIKSSVPFATVNIS